MNDPERLLASEGEDVRAMLRAASEEEPSAAATAQLRNVLGLASAPVTVPLTVAKVSRLALVSRWVGLASVGVIGSYGALQLATPAPRSALVEAHGVAAEPSARPADTLGDELRRLETARAASAPVHALRVLDAYDSVYPRGTLREEAQALRIDTLLALARRDEGQALARTFLQDYPTSVHAARVRARLDAP